ncbi:MAG: hypothetical protein ACR2QK_04200 [Acidimicrobiales bacterium]
MAAFTYEETPVAVGDNIADSHRQAWAKLAEPGTWWTSAQRLAIADRARRLFAARATPPWLRRIEDPGGLSDETIAIVDKITLDAGNVDRPWAESAMADIGDGAYVELIAVVAITVMIDVFAEAVGVDKADFPTADRGEPSRIRPDGLGDIGAHVPALDPFPGANVARALSLVPEANKLFRTVSVPTYSAPGFDSLQWDTPLTRPQVELVASRVAAMNECFY